VCTPTSWAAGVELVTVLDTQADRQLSAAEKAAADAATWATTVQKDTVGARRQLAYLQRQTTSKLATALNNHRTAKSQASQQRHAAEKLGPALVDAERKIRAAKVDAQQQRQAAIDEQDVTRNAVQQFKNSKDVAVQER
jgi:hypothetical protein